MGNLMGAAWFLMALCVLGVISGCSTMTIQTEQDKYDHVIDQYLPIGVKVKTYTAYDLKRETGRNISGLTECDVWILPGTCTIKTIVNAEILLHEICHVMQKDWHGSRGHTGLQGCRFFNYDTLTML